MFSCHHDRDLTSLKGGTAQRAGLARSPIQLIVILSVLLLGGCRSSPLSVVGGRPSTLPLSQLEPSLFLKQRDCERQHGELECRRAKELLQTWREQPGQEGQQVRLFVTGDVGKRTADPVRSHPDAQLVRQAGQVVCGPTCQSALFLGDNLYTWGIKTDADTQFLQNFTQMYLDRRIPFVSSIYFVQGNHDWNPLFPSRDRAQNLHRDIVWAFGDQVHGAAHFWHAQLGPLRVVSLDSNYLVRACRPEWASSRKRPGAGRLPLEQDSPALWQGHDLACPRPRLTGASAVGVQELAEIVGNVGADATMVVAHHPWFSNGLHGTAGWYRDFSCSHASQTRRTRPPTSLCADYFPGEAFRIALERVVRPRSALYLSGHDHLVQAHLSPDAPGLLSLVVGSGSKVSPAGTRTQGGEDMHQKDVVLQAHCYLGFAVVQRSPAEYSVQAYSLRGSGTDDCLAKSRGRAPVHSRGALVKSSQLAGEVDLRCRRFRLYAGKWRAEAECRDLSAW